MKAVLFCQNPYAFGILNPIKEELLSQGDTYMWYVPSRLLAQFPYKEDVFTTSIKEVADFVPDAHFVPGNEIPYYLRGVKAQIFHGLASEKKGHLHIRHYFDLYLTPGPLYTRDYEFLKNRYRNFEVVETGWSKLDPYSYKYSELDDEKMSLLKAANAQKMILYAPTFSPSLTSAPYMVSEVEKLAQHPEYLILIKFHDLMDKSWVQTYEGLALKYDNIKIERNHSILKYLLMADLMVSDTSSVIYEFLLLDKPVITFKNISRNIKWDNQLEYANLDTQVRINLQSDPYRENRKYIFDQFHPYRDGGSSRRMVMAVKDYIAKFGVPSERKISLLRKLKIIKMFGRI